MSNTSNDSDEEAGKKEEVSEELEEVSEGTEAAEGVEEQPPVEAEAAPESEAVEEEEEGAEKPEEEVEIVEERIYTIPFRKAWATPRGKRTPHVVRMLRSFVQRHMKTEDIKISNEVNEQLWARSTKKPPRQITVRLVKDKEGKVIVYPATSA